MRLPFHRPQVRDANRRRILRVEIEAMMQDLGILQPCEHHPAVLLHRTEISDVSLAVSIGCSMITVGQINATEKEVAQAVIATLESSDDRCFSCAMEAHD